MRTGRPFAIADAPPVATVSIVPSEIAAKLTVVPQAASVAVGRGQSVSADTAELRGILTARSAHRVFDSQTNIYGDSERNPTTRMAKTWGWRLGVGCVGTFAASMAVAVAAASITDGVAGYFVGLGISIPLFTGIVGGLGLSFSSDAARTRAAARALPPDALEPLRGELAKATTPLERAIIGELAKNYAADLDARKARGETARTVLRDIIADTETIDGATRSTAMAIVDCFAITHDELGRICGWLAEDTVVELEHAIANMSTEDAAKVRAMLLALLYVGDKARPEAEFESESRLYRVLAGIEPARGKMRHEG